MVPVAVPFLTRVKLPYFNRITLDRTPRDTSRTFYVIAMSIDVMAWLPRSPDLSPIDHVMDILGRRVRERHNVNNVADLSRALQQEWNQITIHELQNLIRSMRRRCLAVVAANGGHTKY